MNGIDPWHPLRPAIPEKDALGRIFTPHEDTRREHVAVVSDAVWRAQNLSNWRKRHNQIREARWKLAEYDQQVARNPYDIVDQLQRCRFIDQFIANYEYASFIEELSELEEQCRTQLMEQRPEHPEVLLWDLERTYGDQLLTKGAELARRSTLGTWTQGQMARLYTMLARAAESSDKGALALEYSLKALDLDETSDVRLIAANQLIAKNDKPRALEILSAPVQAEDSRCAVSVPVPLAQATARSRLRT